MTKIAEKPMTESDRSHLIAAIICMEGPEQQDVFRLLEYLQYEQRQLLKNLIDCDADERKLLLNQLHSIEFDIDLTQEYLKKIIHKNQN